MRDRALLPVAIFAIAMAFVEAACVVSLKRLYYPEGWSPPFHPFPAAGLRLEQWREIATLVMLAAVAVLGRDGLRGFVRRGLWAFGIWDLGYYLFLRLLTGYPQRLTDLDVVFLVPVPWVVAVWVPVAASTLCLVLALLLTGRRR